jgi:signal peptidase I
MSTAVLDLPAAPPAPAFRLAPATARLVIRALFGLVVLGLLTLVVGPRLYPFQGFYVRSGSMSPTIPLGALVIATRAPADELGVGDVIVFHRPDRPTTIVVHRIYAVEQTPTGRAFLTKGDANDSADSWTVPATGEGWRAVYSFSRAGFTVGWLHAAVSRRGWVGAFAIVTALCALISIWQCEEP